MSIFVKFPEIENHYREKYINYVASYLFEKEKEDLYSMKYIAELKYDGSNLSFLVSPKGTVKLYSRSGEYKGTPELAANFFDVGNTLKRPEYIDMLEKMKLCAKEEKTDIQFYGEYYGAGIQKRIAYGPDTKLKYIKLFGVRRFDSKNDNGHHMISPEEFEDLLKKYDLFHLRVEVLAHFDSLTDALNFDISNIKEPSNPTEKNIIEGVVIKTYNRNIYTNEGIFYLKLKNGKFGEGCKTIKTPKEGPAQELIELHNAFLEYINENRVEGIYSKLGKRIQKPSEFGDYIREILDDAVKDFMKDNDSLELSKDQRKVVFAGHKKIMEFLKKDL